LNQEQQQQQQHQQPQPQQQQQQQQPQSLQLDLPADAAVSSKGGTLIRVLPAASITGKMTASASCSSSGVMFRGSTALWLLKDSARVPEGVSR
jgi:hypothetical protein